MSPVEIALLSMLGVALAATIGLLGTALFSLRGDVRDLRTEIHAELTSVRERLAAVETHLA